MKTTAIRLSFRAKKKIVALGSNAKNTVCLLVGNTAYVSPVHKNLDDPTDYTRFVKTLKTFLKERPDIIACDLHPDYASTKFALSSLHATHYTLHRIQHHHAHIVSCMAENRLENERVIGIAFDGTGMGRDFAFWGAECLICDFKNFNRKVYLKEIPLIGGEKAILEPWRIASFWLWSLYKDKFLKLGIPFTKNIPADKWKIFKKMYQLKLNSPLSSSMGRLFDAASSIILARDKAGFEAELAVELERLASASPVLEGSYKFKIEKKNTHFILNPQPVFSGIVSDLKIGISKEKIAYKFHLTIAEMVVAASRLIRAHCKIRKVVLSGGVFQNNILLKLCSALLYKEGFIPIVHKKVACSDAGISLGQAVIASFQGQMKAQLSERQRS